MIFNANYYQAKFQAGLQLIGRTLDGMEEWFGTQQQFKLAEHLEHGVMIHIAHEND